MTVQPIDPNAGYPSLREAKLIQKYAPKCWELFYGKKYILPNYRTQDYFRQDFINWMDWALLAEFPFAMYRDDIMNATFCNAAGSLYYRRPTLFLETELSALLRAALPEDMLAQDIKWRWPTMRIYLPKGLITLTKNSQEHHLMFIDIGLLQQDESRQLPPALAKELDTFAHQEHPDQKAWIKFDQYQFHYPDRAIVLSGMLNCIDGLNANDLTTYAMVKPFKDQTIAQVRAMTKHLKSAWDCDEADDVITHKMEHLALQILLFLSMRPEEYKPEMVLRKPSAKGDRQISGLYAARFVGKSQRRADRTDVVTSVPLERATGYHMSYHIRGGHWKRQPCGPRWQDRKWIWIFTYEAGGGKEEITDQASADSV
jgi:hypothetical protein